MGKTFITIGVIFIIVGLIFLYKDKVPFIKYLGKLPGDLSIEKENFKFYFPLATSLLLSLILSFLLWLFKGR
jgi:hypothetical protein